MIVSTQTPAMGERLLRRVWLVGAPRITQADESVAIPSNNIANLFVFLILHPTVTHRREMLAAWLAPNVSPERASRDFSALLYRLRQFVGATWVETTEEYTTLCTDTALWVDVWEFERLVETGDLSLLTAIELYRDDLTPEIYDDWVLP